MASQRKTALIAPCGMSCWICRAYLREKNRCHGCRASDDNKPITRLRCKIKSCEVFSDGKAKFCFQCEDFPCRNLKHLDKRYRTRYNMSMIENLKNIKNFGITNFLKNEKSRWACPKCGSTVCVHTGRCFCCEE